MDEARIPLSILIAMREPWPLGSTCLDRLYPQARDVGAEIVVGLGDPRARPDNAAQRYPGIVWLEAPGTSVFALRRLALARARGDLIALTEDHAHVTPGWCAAVLAAHAAHPEADAIGGVVENGSTDSATDW